jgi:hypothetical protein
MNTVVIRRSRIQIDTARGPTRSYSPAAARCIAWLCERPDLARAVLPLLQDADPLLAWALCRLGADGQSGGALARALVGAADQLSGEVVRLTTPAPVSGTDGPSASDLMDLDGRD